MGPISLGMGPIALGLGGGGKGMGPTLPALGGGGKSMGPMSLALYSGARWTVRCSEFMDNLTVPLPRLVGKKCQEKACGVANQRKDETDHQKNDV